MKSEKQPNEIQNKRIEYDNIIYYINEEEKEAIIIGCSRNQEKITIPQWLNVRSNKYEITSINDNAFKNSKVEIIEISSESKLKTIGKHAFSFSKIKRIKIPSSVTSIGEGTFHFCQQLEEIIIPSDSKLQTIEKGAFSHSKIKSITIPSELIELKEGWCNCTSKLTKITVSPRNPRYFCYEDKMIIGKTNIEQDNYDCLIFCVRDIIHIQIPNFIKYIGSYSFAQCNQLDEIHIPSDSKLETIEKYAFSSSGIKSITIPSSVTSIGKHAFVSSRIKRIKIPSTVTSIGECAFYNCKQLEKIIIPNDSKLQTIEKDAFSLSKIKSITIPSELIELKEGWCNFTFDLTKITVSPRNPRYFCYEEKMIIGKTNIEQDNYDCLIFCVRDIRHIQIPNFIKHICSSSFDHCNQLDEIHIPSDSKLETIDDQAFSSSTIKHIIIPSTVTSIGERAFSDCQQLEEIIIPSDSKLITIDQYAFCFSKIKRIIIPSSVTSIGERTYYCCKQLEEIIIPSDSKLQAIEKDTFSHSTIKSITIPSSVSSIQGGAFNDCKMLQIIEINNREMISIYAKSFKSCTNILLMIPVE